MPSIYACSAHPEHGALVEDGVPTASSPEQTRALLVQIRDESLDEQTRLSARDAAVAAHLDLTDHLARRFRNRGEPLDDLVQVARLGLVKAVDGFDPDRGVEFVSYAVPTIVGEIKRHFRDKGWSVRVPRRLKDLKMDLSRASATLTQDLGRMPTATDLAGYLKVSLDEVRECVTSSAGYAAVPLSAPMAASRGEGTYADLVGGPDPAMDTVEDRESLRPLLAALPSRERRIIGMRYYENLTQSQIAAQVGVSQMHVSRLLSRSLTAMRKGLVLDGSAGGTLTQ